MPWEIGIGFEPARRFSRRNGQGAENLLYQCFGGGGRDSGTAAKDEAVGEHRHGQALNIIGDHVVSLVDDGPGLSGTV